MSLIDKAMLVTFSLSKPGLTRKDKGETKEVARRTGGDEKSFAVTKRLLQGNKPYDAIRKLDAALGAYHRSQTLPWDDDGTRILPTLGYDAYMANYRRKKDERDKLIADFLRGYDAFVQADRVALGTAFKAADYPSFATMRAKFDMKVHPSPIPDGKDFRVTIGKAELAEMQASVAQRIADAEANVRRDLFSRLAEPLQKMATVLGNTEKKLTMNDTSPMIAGLREILDLIPRLNVLDDPRITAFRDEAEKALANITPETLKKSPAVRVVAAQKAQQIVDAMADFMGAPVLPEPQAQAA